MLESEKKYISMAEMSKSCSYDQEYLSLLARQGKLESKKIGNKWFTTAEAVNQYLQEKKPGEKVSEKEEIEETEEKEISVPKKWKVDYFWLILGISILFLVLVFFIYQKMDNITSQLEAKTLQRESSQENMAYPFNLPGYADFFAPGKLEF